MGTGQLRLTFAESPWIVSRDGDADCLDIFRRHYSHRPYADGRDPKLFIGPGGKLVLVTPALDALFIWRRFKDDSGQTGVNCAAFRNESPALSSLLILEAEKFVRWKWPEEIRLYTYVNPGKIRKKRDPGRCFRKAGWTQCGVTKHNKLVILEKNLVELDL